jgi:hypothetical protein
VRSLDTRTICEHLEELFAVLPIVKTKIEKP